MLDLQTLFAHVTTGTYASWYLVMIAFFAGLLVSFTPCIYPMIPITAGILNAQAGRSFIANFVHALTYACGIATVYATLGYLAATTKLIFGSWLAQPWFIIVVVALFLYLALSMIGVYDLYIPPFFMRSSSLESGERSLLHTFSFGMLSGSITSPCLTPALAMLLGIVAKQGNPFVGFLTLFSFALGMSVVLILVGTFSGALTLLPSSGGWMEDLKKMFGFFMLAGCVSFARPLLSLLQVNACYALVAACASAMYLRNARQSKVSLGLGIAALGVTLTYLTKLVALF